MRETVGARGTARHAEVLPEALSHGGLGWWLMHTVIDTTMLRIDISDDTIDDPTEHHRVRARRVVAYILDRFPLVRYNDAPDEVDDEIDRNADEALR